MSERNDVQALTTVPNQDIYNEMVQFLKIKLQKPFNAAKIVMLIAHGIKFLAEVKTLTGPEKKDLVLHALRQCVLESTYIGDSEKPEIIMVIDLLGSSLVDTLVEFALDAYTFMRKKVRKSWCCRKNRGQRSHDTSATRSLDATGSKERDMLKQYLKLKLQKPITAPKMIIIISAGVKYIQQYKDLSGAEKKNMVINVVRDVIMESDLIPDNEKQALIDAVNTYGDETIDYLVEFGKSVFLLAKNKCRGFKACR